MSNRAALDITTVCSEVDGTLEATLTLPLGSPKLLMPEIAQRAAADTMLRATPGNSVPTKHPRHEADGH